MKSAQTSIVRQAEVGPNRQARLQIEWQRLTLQRPDGARVELDLPRPGEIRAVDREFREHATTERAPQGPKLSWSSTRTYRGAGTAGQLFSVARQQHTTEAWFGRRGTTELATYDARDGSRVRLDSLLNPGQMNRLVANVTSSFNALAHEQFAAGEDVNRMTHAQVRELVNTRFALDRAPNGATSFEFAWETQRFNGPSGLVARFTVDAPTDAAFRSKVGLAAE